MLVRYIRRLTVWLLLSMPVGMAFGAAFSAYLGENADLDRFTSGANGAIAGAWLGLLGSIGAVATTTVAHERLKQVGGSQCMTGAIVSFGVIVIGTLLLWVAA